MRESARTIHHLWAGAAYRPHMARRTSIERVSTAVRLPVDLHAELQRQADERDVSVNFLVTRAVAKYLGELGELSAPAISERSRAAGASR